MNTEAAATDHISYFRLRHPGCRYEYPCLLSDLPKLRLRGGGIKNYHKFQNEQVGLHQGWPMLRQMEISDAAQVMKIRSPNTKMTLKDETTLCLPPPPVSSDKDYRFMNDRSGFDVPLKMLSLSHTLHWIFYRVHVSCIWLKVCMMPGFLRGRGVVVFYNLQYSFPAVSSPPPTPNPPQ